MAQQHFAPLAHNIVASIKGESESKMKKAGGPPGNMIVVPFGKGGGASYLMLGSLGGWATSLIKAKVCSLVSLRGGLSNEWGRM